LTIILTLIALYYLLARIIISPFDRLKILFFGYGGTNIASSFSLINLLRILRNIFLIIVNGYSFFMPLIILIALIILLRKKSWKILFLIFSFLFPFFLTARFWYDGLYGRYSAFIAYGLPLIIALLPKKIYWLAVISVMITFIPTFSSYQLIKPIPLLEKQLIEKVKISNQDLLILSDYQRPQLTYSNDLYINSNGEDYKKIVQKIDQVLMKNRRVFISQQAITFPYLQYDGQMIHIISQGDKNKALLRNFLTNKQLVKIAEEQRFPLLTIYQIK